uniref:Uncharacterized protein n=1 Tax=Cacopsylla melanoneura TaxID=428564 RepID=A0A8D8T2K7_9HEMI
MFRSATVLSCLLGVCLVSQVQGSIVKGVKGSHHAASWKTNHFHPGKILKRSTGDMNPHEGILLRQLPSGDTRLTGEGMLRQIPSDVTYETRQFPGREAMHPGQLPQGRTIGPIMDQISHGIADGLATGLSTGISSGVTNAVYALPNAISGTIQNVKQGQLGGGGLYNGGAQYGGASYLSPIKGGSLSFGSPSISLSSGLGHGTPYASYSKPYPGFAMSPSFSTGFSGKA